MATFENLKKILVQSKKISLIAGCILAAIGIGYSYFSIRSPILWPIQLVRVGGEYLKVGQEQIKEISEPFLVKSFFAADLYGLQQALKQHPWVAMVNISRYWPDTLEIEIFEEQATARWNEKSLFNASGKIFTPKKDTIPLGLPLLRGPENLAKEAFENFKIFSNLVKAKGRKINNLNIDEKNSIEIHLDNGLRIVLGSNDPFLRLKRFINEYEPIIGEKVKDAEKIDLRYPNGLAVRWKRK